jgi:cardiolipin synthase
VKHLPNLISTARILVAPYLFLLLWRREYGLALIVIFLAGVSDGVDGFLARRFHAQSALGAYLDPIGDKLLLSGSFLVLALDRAIPAWLAWIVLGRDALILFSAAGMILFTKTRRKFPPSWWGKASTVAQICYILALLLHFTGFLGEGWVTVGVWFTVGLAAVSGIDYAVKAL